MVLKSFPSFKDSSIIRIDGKVLLQVLALSEEWGRHSLDSAKICSKYLSLAGLDKFPITLHFFDYLLPSSFTFMKVCRVHRCCMDPAKPSRKSLVSYHLFKLCLSLVCFHLIADVQVPLTTSKNYLLDGKSSFVY